MGIGSADAPGAMRRTVVVEGPLAVRMRRAEAARNGEAGLQVVTISVLASRLAGGFQRLAGPDDIEPAIKAALDQGGFEEIGPICTLPGMTRAVARTLRKIWESNLDLTRYASQSVRLADLALIQRRIRKLLPSAALLPRDLRDLAVERLRYAPAVLGQVELRGISTVAPVWRPLITVLQNWVEVEWHAPQLAEHSWFSGRVIHYTSGPVRLPAPDLVTCSDPRAEVVEALRWIRELLSGGQVPATDVAIAATSPGEWDGNIMALSADVGLPLHFSHGIPALATRDGQRCAALADLLVHGLSQDRVRRLVRLVALQGSVLDELPQDWLNSVPQDAGLLNLDHWERVLRAANVRREDGFDLCSVLMPVLRLISGGPSRAEAAGKLLFRGRPSRLWKEALRATPPDAIEFSLRELRVEDERDPANCVVWCPASHLIGAPRPWTRLLGLSSRSWPRQSGQDDPLVPEHILSRAILDPDSLSNRDRRAFEIIRAGATRGLVLSRSHRRADGVLVAPSPILVRFGPARPLSPTRVPTHAFSESDRLLARPAEAARVPRLAGAVTCWGNIGFVVPNRINRRYE